MKVLGLKVSFISVSIFAISTASCAWLNKQTVRVSCGHTLSNVLLHIPAEIRADLYDLAAKFKEKRISLGLTQWQVSLTIVPIDKLLTSGDSHQSTISQFENLTLSYNNVKKLRPKIQSWMSLEDQLVLALCASVSNYNTIGSSRAPSGQVSTGYNRVARSNDMVIAEPSATVNSAAAAKMQPARIQPKAFSPVPPTTTHTRALQHSRATAQQPAAMEGMYMAGAGYSTDCAKACHQPHRTDSHGAQLSSANPQLTAYYHADLRVPGASEHLPPIPPVDTTTQSHSITMACQGLDSKCTIVSLH